MKHIYILILFILPVIASAQTTIGSGLEPVKAAILDVKTQVADDNNVTSTIGGIVMPRVKLQNIETLEPIILNNDPDLTELKRLHKGLIVYNLTDNEAFKAGLYVWKGTRWNAVILSGTNPESTSNIEVENGLSLTPTNEYIELGGLLNANTSINQNNQTMTLTTGTGALSINETDLIIKGGNTGVGKEPSSNQKLDVAGDILVNGNLTVKEKTGLKNVEITGTNTNQSHLVYNPNNSKKEQKFLVSSGNSGDARWQTVGGLSSLDQAPLPTNTLRFIPADQTNNYLNTGMGIELSPGKWLISYSVRMVSLNLNSASTANIQPTSFRLTMLDNGVPIPITNKKAYDDCRAYPDTYYNSCTGFIIVNNDSDQDKVYYLGIKTQQIGLNWPSGEVELINASKNDAYLVPLLLDYK